MESNHPPAGEAAPPPPEADPPFLGAPAGGRRPDGTAGSSVRGPGGAWGSSRLSTSLRLFARARRGDASALDRLFARLLPSLRRWTRRRLPSWARRRLDTEDLVQHAFLQLFRRLGGFEPRRRRALHAYLQEAIRNRVRDEVRRAALVETSQRSALDPADPASSPLDHAISQEDAARYREALARLEPGDQELVVGRVELGLSYEQLALATGRPSPDATRVAIRRALLRLAEEIRPA